MGLINSRARLSCKVSSTPQASSRRSEVDFLLPSTFVTGTVLATKVDFDASVDGP